MTFFTTFGELWRVMWIKLPISSTGTGIDKTLKTAIPSHEKQVVNKNSLLHPNQFLYCLLYFLQQLIYTNINIYWY